MILQRLTIFLGCLGHEGHCSIIPLMSVGEIFVRKLMLVLYVLLGFLSICSFFVPCVGEVGMTGSGRAGTPLARR